MKYLIQLAILLLYWLIGEWISVLFAPVLLIPGAIWGMLLLFISLTTGLLKEESIKETSDFLLKNIAFFFVPASIGILSVYIKVASIFWILLFIGIFSTIITMLVTMLVTQLLTRKEL